METENTVSGNIERAEKLIKTNGMYGNETLNDGTTPLMAAANQGNLIFVIKNV